MYDGHYKMHIIILQTIQNNINKAYDDINNCFLDLFDNKNKHLKDLSFLLLYVFGAKITPENIRRLNPLFLRRLG